MIVCIPKKYASQIYGIMALRRGIAKMNHMEEDASRAIIQPALTGKYLLSGILRFKEVKVDKISLNGVCFWRNHNLCSI